MLRTKADSGFFFSWLWKTGKILTRCLLFFHFQRRQTRQKRVIHWKITKDCGPICSSFASCSWCSCLWWALLAPSTFCRLSRGSEARMTSLRLLLSPWLARRNSSEGKCDSAGCENFESVEKKGEHSWSSKSKSWWVCHWNISWPDVWRAGNLMDLTRLFLVWKRGDTSTISTKNFVFFAFLIWASFILLSDLNRLSVGYITDRWKLNKVWLWSVAVLACGTCGFGISFSESYHSLFILSAVTGKEWSLFLWP